MNANTSLAHGATTITRGQAKEAITSYFKKWYKPSNLVETDLTHLHSPIFNQPMNDNGETLYVYFWWTWGQDNTIFWHFLGTEKRIAPAE